jgi:hypothetical protein
MKDGKKDIACDLDGTLAHYDGWKGIAHIGEPIPGTLERVKTALAAGHSVSIFTARVSYPDDAITATEHIHEWCRKHLGLVLEVTAIKHGYFDEFWDDKAIRVEANRGFCCFTPAGSAWEACAS